MPLTPDRHPGEADEEGEVFENRPPGEQPTQQGGVRFVDGSFQLRDYVGVFNPRSGGGITEAQHEVLDTLVHDIAEPSYEEHFYANGHTTQIIVWTDVTKTVKILEEQYTYVTGQISQSVTIQYGPTGVELTRMIETYTYGAGKVITVTRTRIP